MELSASFESSSGSTSSNEAAANVDDLSNFWLEAPFPVLQQVIANQLSYFEQLPDIPAIVGQMLSNAVGAVSVPFIYDEHTITPGRVRGVLDPAVKPDLFDQLSAQLSWVPQPQARRGGRGGADAFGSLLGLARAIAEGPRLGPPRRR